MNEASMPTVEAIIMTMNKPLSHAGANHTPKNDAMTMIKHVMYILLLLLI